MFKIGEFSRLSRVSIRMLRYYDEKGLLHPATVEPSSGYRFYQAAQLEELQKIIFLRDVGFSVGEMKELLGHWEPAYLSRRLAEKQRDWQEEIRRQKEIVEKLSHAKNEIIDIPLPASFNLSVREIPAVPVVSLRRVIPRYDCEQELWNGLVRQMECCGVSPAPNAQEITVFYDEEHREEGVDAAVCLELAALPPAKAMGELRFEVLPAVKHAACVMVPGPFERIGGAFQQAARWLEEHSLWHMVGLTRQVCHAGPPQTGNPEEFLTEIQIPVEKIK